MKQNTNSRTKRILAFLVYSTILAASIFHYGVSHQQVEVNVGCLSNQNHRKYCAHCFKTPLNTKPQYRWKGNDRFYEISRLAVKSDRNFTCNEILEAMDLEKNNPTLLDTQQVQHFMQLLNATVIVYNNQVPLAAARQWVVFGQTGQSQKLEPYNITVPYKDQQITNNIIFVVVGLTLLISMYSSSIILSQVGWSPFLISCTIQLLLCFYFCFGEYANIWVLVSAHTLFGYYIFSEMRCLRFLKIAGALLNGTIWTLHFMLETDWVTPFLQAFFNAFIITIVVYSHQSTVGRPQIFGSALFVLYSALTVVDKLNIIYPSEIVTVGIMCFMIAILSLYRTDSIEFGVFRVNHKESEGVNSYEVEQQEGEGSDEQEGEQEQHSSEVQLEDRSTLVVKTTPAVKKPSSQSIDML